MDNRKTSRMSFFQVILTAAAGLTFILLTEWLHGWFLGGSYDILGAAYCVAIYSVITLPFFWISNISNRAIIIRLRRITSSSISIIMAAIFTVVSVLTIGAVFTMWQNDISLERMRVIIKIFFIAGFFMGLTGALQEDAQTRAER